MHGDAVLRDGGGCVRAAGGAERAAGGQLDVLHDDDVRAHIPAFFQRPILFPGGMRPSLRFPRLLMLLFTHPFYFSRPQVHDVHRDDDEDDETDAAAA